MNRIWALTVFLTRDLFLSLAGTVPLVTAVAFGLIAFEYGMDQAQFITVAGVGTGIICFLTALLLANRANRASSYLLMARLHQRAELLASLVLSSLGITAGLSALIAAGNLLGGRLTLDWPSALWIVPSWLPVWLLAAALALPLAALVERGGSHLLGYVLLTALLIANDQKERLMAHGLGWLAHLVTTILWPVRTLLAQASAGLHDTSYLVAGVLTVGYVGLLFGLASLLFEDKDLLWAE
jgi:hypothetical protein